MCNVVQGADVDEQLVLIRTHPDLEGCAILPAESREEQATAGLNDSSVDEAAQFDSWNRDYHQRFGFPFVICARLNKKEAILAAFPQRLRNTPAQERNTALSEIYEIFFRFLADFLGNRIWRASNKKKVIAFAAAFFCIRQALCSSQLSVSLLSVLLVLQSAAVSHQSPRMHPRHFPLSLAATLLLSQLAFTSATPFPTLEVSGNATIGGTLDLAGNSFWLGTATGNSTTTNALSLTYTDDPTGAGSILKLSIAKPTVAWLWENYQTDGTYRPQMRLDATNKFQLFNAAGVPVITLDPAAGISVAAGSGLGVTLSDGKRLQGASSLNALYDAAGNAVVSVNGTGGAFFNNAAVFDQGLSFTGGGALGSGNVTYMEGLLANFGYNGSRALAVDLSLSFPTQGAANLYVNRTTLDGAGNIYACGGFQQPAFLQGATLTGPGAGDAFVAKLTPTGALSWSRVIGGVGADSANRVAVDGGGNVYVGGSFSGTMTVGSTTLTSVGTSDIYIVKYTSNGTLAWVTSAGGSGSDSVNALCVDGAGSLAICGTFNGTAALGPTTLTSAGGSDSYVAKVNSLGAFQWARSLGGTGNDNAPDLGVDAVGNICVGGTFSGSGTFGGVSLTSAGSQDIYLVSLGGDGSTRWVKSFGGISPDGISRLHVSATGEVDLCGYFHGTVAFGAISIVSGGVQDGYIARISSSGAVLSARELGGTANDSVSALTRDGSGNLLVTGSFVGPTDFLGTSYPSGSFPYLLKLDAAQNLLWFKTLPGSLNASYMMSNAGKILINGSVYTNTRLGEEVLVAPGAYAYVWDGAELSTPGGVTDARLAWGTSVAEQTGAVALGRNALARGVGSFAGGASTASGSGAVALGQGATASGSNSVALGSGTFAGGYAATAFGNNTDASGNTSFAAGNNTVAAGGGSTAFGYSSKANGEYSTAFGHQTRADAYLSSVFGRYNVGGFTNNGNTSIYDDGNRQWIARDSLLEVGNGSGTSTYDPVLGISTPARSNAFTLFKNGTLRNGGVIEAKGGVRTPPMGDLDMGAFATGQNPANLKPELGLRYTGE